MKNRAFHFEIKDILTQFIAAFDDTVISRFDKNKTSRQDLEVRYVMAPKQRVMYDIINKAQNITLPVVTVDIASISRDETRVFNKLEPSYMPKNSSGEIKDAVPFLMPVPVDIEVNMSILARYMLDVDQIISNFVPYTNPYVVLTWKVPDAYQFEYDNEIRTPVLWSGTLNYNTPTETTYSDKFRIVVDTSFTIKAWLFPEVNYASAPIYKVTSNFISVDLRNRLYSPTNKRQVVESRSFRDYGYQKLSGYDPDEVPIDYVETVAISGIPEFTNIFYSTTGALAPISNNLYIKNDLSHNFVFYGKRFDYSNNFYLSSNTSDFFTGFQEITSGKSPTISGYQLPSSYFTILNDNVISLYLPASTFNVPGDFTIISQTEAGWGTTYQASNSIFSIVT